MPGQPEETGTETGLQGAVSIKMTYSTDEARIMPAVAQGLQEPISSINLKVTAVALSAKHLLIVWREKGEQRTGGEWGDYKRGRRWKERQRCGRT